LDLALAFALFRWWPRQFPALPAPGVALAPA